MGGMVISHLVFLRRTEADRADRVVVGTFCEGQHKQTIADETDGDEANLAVVEAVVLALQRRVPIEGPSCRGRDPMFGEVRFVLAGSNPMPTL